MLDIKLGRYFFTNIVEFRGFINLHHLMDCLEDITYTYIMGGRKSDVAILVNEKEINHNLCFGISYKTFKQADNRCSKICDGETEHTFKVEVYMKESYPSGNSDYICYITDCSIKDKKRWERIEIGLDAKLIEKIFNVKVIE